MQVIKKTFEYFTAEKYCDLEYGTIYYVPGTSSHELNDYICARADEIAAQLNNDDRNWVTCRIVYLTKDNPLFAPSSKPTLHSAMLPTSDTPANACSFLKASLDITEPSIVEDALIEYFRTLQLMFDDILDKGTCSHYLLTSTILSPVDDQIRFSVSRREMDFDENRIKTCECLDMAYEEEDVEHFDYPSRLEITPNTFQVLLPDYHREIKFNAQIKALYVLFLNHPEGIRMKEIGDYKEEYKQLYLYFTNRGNLEQLRLAVDKLFDAYNPNTLNVKKSQCSEQLRIAIPEDNLRQYYEIQVHRGEPHKINLDRSLVSMPDFLHQL